MAKKVKVAKAAKDALPRLKTSLYTSPFVTLHFGPTHQIYYLPEVLLQRLENIPSRDPWTREIHLIDVEASIGHVLIHFLHTGVYQTLNGEDVEDIENTHKIFIRNEFQTAVLTLKAAKKYSVSGLQELAQIELERRGKDMCLRDAVCAIPEELIAGPPDEHAWLRDYVSKKVRWTFSHDPPTLSAPDFFESIESPTLTQLLAQVIVSLYSEEVDKLRKGKTATGKILTPEHSEAPESCSHDLPRLPSKRIATNSTARPASVEKFGAFDDSVAVWDPHNLGQDPGNRPEASAPAVLSSCNKEEKMELEKRMKEEAAAKERENAEARVQEEGLTELQQLEAEKGTIAQLQKQDVAADVAAVAAIVPAAQEDPEEEAAKTRRREEEEAEQTRLEEEGAEWKKIKEEEATAAVAEAETSRKKEDDIWGDWGAASAGKKKKKKGKKTEQIRLEEGERVAKEAEERSQKEEEELLAKEAGEEAERRKKEEEEAAAAAVAKPSILSATSGLTWVEEPALNTDDWASLRATPTYKKKKKKGKKSERVSLEEEEAERIRLEEEEAERIRLEEEEAERIRLEYEEKEAAAAAAAAAATEACVSAFDSTIETNATSNDDDCKLRLEHLSRNDGWQNCKPCELYMRKIAIMLHTVGLPNVNGFSTIN